MCVYVLQFVSVWSIFAVCCKIQMDTVLWIITVSKQYSSTLHIGWHLFSLRNVWIIEDTVNVPIFGCTLRPASAIVRPWLTTWSTIVALILSDMRLCPWPLLPLPLFCLCTLPPYILTPLLPLSCWPWLFPGCSSIVTICNSCVIRCIYMLSNWRIMRCTFELFQRTGLSLVELHSLHWWKSRFTCTTHGIFTKRLIEMCAKYAWPYMTTRSIFLHLVTYTIN